MRPLRSTDGKCAICNANEVLPVQIQTSAAHKSTKSNADTILPTLLKIKFVNWNLCFHGVLSTSIEPLHKRFFVVEKGSLGY